MRDGFMFRTKVLLGGAYCENFVTPSDKAPGFYTFLTINFAFTRPAAIDPNVFEILSLN